MSVFLSSCVIAVVVCVASGFGASAQCAEDCLHDVPLSGVLCYCILCHCSCGVCLFQDLERVHSVLKIVFMMFPNYCLGRGLIELAFNEYKNEFYFKTGETLCADPHSSMEIP